MARDYRERIIVDPDNPILAFKASRDRFTNLPNQRPYAGLSYLGSWASEDALTWNVFRSLQKHGRLNIISSRLGIGQPCGLLVWTLAPEVDDFSTKLQYTTGVLLRKFDGIFRGQMTEPDIILLGTTGIAVIECKLSAPDEALGHLWEGKLNSVQKRLPIYRKEIPQLVKSNITDEDVATVYQLVRMAFYTMKLGSSFAVQPVLVSLGNKRNWSLKVSKRNSASELWDSFRQTLGKEHPQCESMFWQDVTELVRGESLNTLREYLSGHPCL